MAAVTTLGTYEMEYRGEVTKTNREGEEYTLTMFEDANTFSSVPLRVDDDIKPKLKTMKKGDSCLVKIESVENNGKVYRTVKAIKEGSGAASQVRA